MKPRLIYGPTPVISIKYMSEAMRRHGYETATYVYGVYGINSRKDFDYYIFDIPGASTAAPRSRAGRLLFGRYAVFLWLMRRFDVFHYFFDGGFLAGTPLRFLELQLLHLAAKGAIVMPYGSDVAVPSQIASVEWRRGLAASYPELARHESRTLRQIDYFSRHADVVVACIFHMETLPRWDLLTIHYYPIDTDSWRPTLSPRETRKELVVAHTPNHRSLKGTDELIRACEELQADGYPVRLILLEGVSNDEVRQVVSDCDVLAEQFLHGYALSAIEGMSLGKPVLSNLSDGRYYDLLRLRGGLDECPILSTTPDQIRAHLIKLMDDPDLRRTLGVAGREYVLRFHSFEAVTAMWERVYRRVWDGEEIELGIWKPPPIDEPTAADARRQTRTSA